MSLPGQLAAELPAPAGRPPALALSRTVLVDEGARGALLLADGLFRLDVEPRGDTLRTRVRNLSGEPLVLEPAGYGAPVVLQGAGWEDRTERVTHHDMAFRLGDGDDVVAVSVTIGTVRDPGRGVTRFTAQALIQVAG